MLCPEAGRRRSGEENLNQSEQPAREAYRTPRLGGIAQSARGGWLHPCQGPIGRARGARATCRRSNHRPIFGARGRVGARDEKRGGEASSAAAILDRARSASAEPSADAAASLEPRPRRQNNPGPTSPHPTSASRRYRDSARARGARKRRRALASPACRDTLLSGGASSCGESVRLNWAGPLPLLPRRHRRPSRRRPPRRHRRLSRHGRTRPPAPRAGSRQGRPRRPQPSFPPRPAAALGVPPAEVRARGAASLRVGAGGWGAGPPLDCSAPWASGPQAGRGSPSPHLPRGQARRRLQASAKVCPAAESRGPGPCVFGAGRAAPALPPRGAGPPLDAGYLPSG